MLTFVIPTCIQSSLHLNQLYRCINSIRKYHIDNKIFLINDSSNTFDTDFALLLEKYNNIILIKSLKGGSADQQVFKVILDDITTNIADVANNVTAASNIDEKYIIIQDSMMLNRDLDIDSIKFKEITDVKFLWHFTNHIIHWDIIEEPLTEYNIKHNIKSHTDLIRHHILLNYSDNTEFICFALHRLKNKELWCGCFGSCCIITKSFLNRLNNIFHFVDKFINNASNRERRMNESIFSLMCHFLLVNRDFSDSYDGLYYDGFTVNKFAKTETEFDNLVYCAKNHYISKVSFNR